MEIFEEYEKKYKFKLPNWYKGPCLAESDSRGAAFVLTRNPPTYAHECMKAREKLLKIISAKTMW